jgi:Uncharacterised nucleotidyltransferase
VLVPVVAYHSVRAAVTEATHRATIGSNLMQVGALPLTAPDYRSAARSLAIDRVTAEVVIALGSAGVPAILLKGPSVALWLYPGGAGRPYFDSDLLVSPEGLARAEGVLASLGFVDVLAGTMADERGSHATPWLRVRDGAWIDLHRSIPGVAAPDQELWAELVAGAEPMAVGGATVSILAPVARVMLVALHAAHHGIRSGTPLQDLTRAVGQVDPTLWQAAAALAGRLDATPAFAVGLRLLPAGAAIATQLNLPQSISVEVALRADTAPTLALGFAALHNLPGRRAKLAYLQHNLVPSPAFMRFWSPMASRGRPGMLAAYVWRWLWLFWHVIPGYRAWRHAYSKTRARRLVVGERSLPPRAVDAPTEKDKRPG